jgi:hypothetical protein
MAGTIRPVSTRRLLYAIALAAGFILLYQGLLASDFLSVGRRPDPSALHDSLLSGAVGLVLGASCALFMRSLYRHNREFFVEFYATPISQRGWRLQSWHLLYSLPMVIAVEILVITTFAIEVPPPPALLAALLWLPIVGPQLEEILRAASERKTARAGATEGSKPITIPWTRGRTLREFAERLTVSLLLVAAVGLAGYTLCLPRLEEIEKSRSILRQIFAPDPAAQNRFYFLTHLARSASRTCDANRIAGTEHLARELLQRFSGLTYDWNHGNAIHYANLALGRVALRRGDTEQAKTHLLRAGGTPGSPQLGDYGPDMTLARELLERGEAATVLRYLSLCSRFWRNERRNCVLSDWTAAVESGQIPDFGSWAGPVPRPAEGWTCELLESPTQVRREWPRDLVPE